MLKFQAQILEMLDQVRISQINRIKNFVAATRRGVLYVNILSETNDMVLYMVNLFESLRDFVLYTHKKLLAPKPTVGLSPKKTEYIFNQQTA